MRVGHAALGCGLRAAGERRRAQSGCRPPGRRTLGNPFGHVTMPWCPAPVRGCSRRGSSGGGGAPRRVTAFDPVLIIAAPLTAPRDRPPGPGPLTSRWPRQTVEALPGSGPTGCGIPHPARRAADRRRGRVRTTSRPDRNILTRRGMAWQRTGSAARCYRAVRAGHGEVPRQGVAPHGAGEAAPSGMPGTVKLTGPPSSRTRTARSRPTPSPERPRQMPHTPQPMRECHDTAATGPPRPDPPPASHLARTRGHRLAGWLASPGTMRASRPRTADREYVVQAR